jgi:uncharacterized membrane protein
MLAGQRIIQFGSPKSSKIDLSTKRTTGHEVMEMELLQGWEHGLNWLVAWAKIILESISVFCVMLGLLKTGQLVVQTQRRQRRGEEFPFNQIRLRFGTWLAVALEFQLGADVLATTVAPSTEDLIRLAIIAVVRTLLNYFLGKELEAEMELEHRKEAHQAHMAKTYGPQSGQV